jgi:hypothetical protein
MRRLACWTFSAAGLIRSVVIQETEVGFAKLGRVDFGFSNARQRRWQMVQSLVKAGV